MNEEKRQERRKKDMDELYRAIGEFIVKFELVCLAIQSCIVFLLHHAGLRDQKISQIILAGELQLSRFVCYTVLLSLKPSILTVTNRKFSRLC